MEQESTIGIVINKANMYNQCFNKTTQKPTPTATTTTTTAITIKALI